MELRTIWNWLKKGGANEYEGRSKNIKFERKKK